MGVAAVVVVALSVSGAAAKVVTFQGGPRDTDNPPVNFPNDWNDTFNWANVDNMVNEFPNNGVFGHDYDVLIDDGDDSVDRVAIVNVSVTIDSLAISGGDTVDIPNGRQLSIVSGGLVNNGLIQLLSDPPSSASTRLSFDGVDQSITGSGEIVMNTDSNNSVRTNTPGLTITHGPGHTIRGGGAILNDIGSMINQGSILADDPRQLVINPGDDPGDALTNQGTVLATGAQGMRITDGMVINTGASLTAGDGSHIELFFGVTVVGGTLETIGSGVIELQGAAIDGVTNNGTVEQDDTTTITMRNGLTNNSLYTILPNPGASAQSRLVADGTQTIGGTGTFDLGNDSNNGIVAIDDSTVITIGADQTLIARGFLLDGNGGFVNNGTVVVTDRHVTINPGSGGFVNNGTIKGNDEIIFTGNVAFTNDGTVAPGLSAGTLTIQDDVVMTGTAVLEIEIGGAGAGQFDVLEVFRPSVATATAALDGVLDVSLLGGFNPDPSDTFTILTTDGGVSGFFDNAVPSVGMSVQVVEADVTYTLTYNANDVVIGDLQAIPEPGSGVCLVTVVAAGFGGRRRMRAVIGRV